MSNEEWRWKAPDLSVSYNCPSTYILAPCTVCTFTAVEIQLIIRTTLMPKIIYPLLCLAQVVVWPIFSTAQPDTVKVLAWNILHGANDIPQGRYQAIEVIKVLDPDIILMVETYGSGKEMADSLGMYFHLIEEEGTPLNDPKVNLSIFSKFPFGKRIDTPYPFYLGGREVLIHGQTIRFFSNWFHYEPWHDAPETLGKTPDELLAWEKTGKKWEMFNKVKPSFQQLANQADSIAVIIGGDMNTPSHLDWTQHTQDQHEGLIVPWQTTRALEQLGFIDTYRQIHPNPKEFPGITWNAKEKKDEHRIDYIFYKGNTLKAIASESHQTYLGELLSLKGRRIPYPSDHGLVLTTFVLNED